MLRCTSRKSVGLSGWRSVAVLAGAVIGLTLAGEASAAGQPYPIVDTGQTDCYDASSRPAMRSCPDAGEAYYGQDAQYRLNPPQYRDNGDATVTDRVTGLMWQKGFTRDVQWEQAQQLADRARTGGYRDWRVPTTKELYSLILFSGATGMMRDPYSTPRDARPYLDEVFDFEYPTDPAARRALGNDGQTARFIDAQYIASTVYVGMVMRNQKAFFGVNFADGRIKGYGLRPGGHRGIGFYLKLVRGNPAYGKNSFRDQRNGTVADRATGLTWMQMDSGHSAFRQGLGNTHYRDGRMDWGEALAFCEGLTFAGATDWRLPNAKELQSLLDYTRSPDTTGSAAIDPVFQATSITNEAGKRDFPTYWTSTSHLDGRYPGDAAVIVHFGRALGAMQRPGQGGGGQRGGAMGRPGGGFGPPPMGSGPGGGFSGPPPMGRPGQGGGGFPPPPPQGGFPPSPPQGGFPPSPPQGGFGPPPMMGGGPGGQSGGPGQSGPGQSGPGQSGPGQSGPGQGRPGQGGMLPASSIMDVHGAGAQRSDPKAGNPSQYPQWGKGPQGDVRRVYNYVRCVR